MDHGEQFFNSSGAGAYQIERSLRFNSADSSYLNRTPASAGNRKTWTWAGWVKRSGLGSYQYLLCAGTNENTDQSAIRFNVDETIDFFCYTGSFEWRLNTTQVFRDTSAWLHIVAVVDTDNATADNRQRLYINGSEVTAFSSRTNASLGAQSSLNNNTEHRTGIASFSTASTFAFSGYLADVHFIDGQALDPTSFGEFDANGIWQPKAYTGSYGTNGFHLPFNDNSTAAALGTDTSGNGNTWTVNNISVAAGAGNDSLVDSPTNYGTDTGAGGEVRGNYCTLNPLASAGTMSNGNLDGYNAVNTTSHASMAMPSSGKWYFDGVMTSGNLLNLGLASYRPNGHVFPISNSVLYSTSGVKNVDGVLDVAYGATWTTGDIIGVACDSDANTVTFYKNGVSQGAISHQVGGLFPSFGNGGIDVSYTVNFGQRPFAYPAPSGFKALNTANLPTPTIADGSTAMDVVTYTGNGGTQTISGLEFSPDLVWAKNQTLNANHRLFDTVRGADRILYSSLTNSEATDALGLTAFTSSGFSVGPNQINNSGNSFVAWTWDAGSSTVTNNDGTITSQVRANPSAGFSIVTYTGNGTTGATVGHGLNAAPQMIFTKMRNSGIANWNCWHTSIPLGNFLSINTTSPAQSQPNYFTTTLPTSSVFYLGNDLYGPNAGGITQVAYCFAPVEGYSAFGSYTGNGSADGPFVFCNFRPRWVMIKYSSGADGNWVIYDALRGSYNLNSRKLAANLSAEENNAASLGDDAVGIDFLSNGFKLRTTGLNHNTSSGIYLYAAFAENPFALNARAR